MEKNEGKKISLTAYLLSLILMALVCGILVYLVWTGAIGGKKNEQEVAVTKTENIAIENPEEDKTEISEKETTKKENIEIEGNATETEKTQIEEYIEKIYPISPCDMGHNYFEAFTSIQNANQAWIWSTTLRECAEDKIGDSYGNSSVDEINKTAKKLYGEKVGNLPVEKISEELNEDLYIMKNGDSYEYMGNRISGENSSRYKILSINKDSGLFKVEVAQYSVHHWSDGISINSINGYKTLKEISEGSALDLDDDVDMNEINKEIDEYIDNNIDKLDKVELTIEYDKANKEYHVISITNK